MLKFNKNWSEAIFFLGSPIALARHKILCYTSEKEEEFHHLESKWISIL